MLYKIFADAVAVLHAAHLFFVLAGPFWARRHPRVRLVHLADMWWTLAVTLDATYCPLTSLENSFRAHYNPGAPYTTGFIQRHVAPLLWWDLTRPQIAAGMFLWVVLWTWVYAHWWSQEKKNRKKEPT